MVQVQLFPSPGKIVGRVSLQHLVASTSHPQGSGDNEFQNPVGPLPNERHRHHFFLKNSPIRLTQCCTQFRSLGVKVLCVFHLHDNIAFTFKWYGNTWNKSFYSQRIWIGYNIELAELVYREFIFLKIFVSLFRNKLTTFPTLDGADFNHPTILHHCQLRSNVSSCEIHSRCFLAMLCVPSLGSYESSNTKRQPGNWRN